MKFHFNPDKANYEHLAAGRVLLSQAGATSFPVRLASEIFQLCYAHLGKERLSLYDPCCGTAYLLTTLGFLHHEQIQAFYGSDISLNALTIARKNLGLLSKTGLLERRAAIAELYASYGKESHAGALQSCDVLMEALPEQDIFREIWLADAISACLAPETLDLLICDVPYGEKVDWAGDSPEPIYQLLEAHYPALKQRGLAVIISDKSQKAAHPGYRRYKQINHGKRRIMIMAKDEHF